MCHGPLRSVRIRWAWPSRIFDEDGLADRVPLDYYQTTIHILMVPGGYRPGSYLTHLGSGKRGEGRSQPWNDLESLNAGSVHQEP